MLFPKVLTGGYIGVDVFFVISGFLISKNILQDLNTNSFRVFFSDQRRACKFLQSLSVTKVFCTYAFFEKPLKTSLKIRFSSLQINAALGICMIIVSFLGLMTFQKNGFAQRFSSLEELVSTKKEFRESIDGAQSSACRKKIFKIEICALADFEKDPTVALIGDSHANQFYPPLKDYFTHKGENLILLAKSGVPSLINVTVKREGENSLENVFKWVLENPKIHTVILASFWSSYFNEHGTTTGKTKYKGILQDKENQTRTKQQEIFEIHLAKTLQKLADHNKKIIFFFDILSTPFYLDHCVNRQKQVFSLNQDTRTCTFEQGPSEAEQIEYRKSVQQILKAHPQVTSFDPMIFNCQNSVCDVVRDNQFMYSDEHHLSVGGAYLLLKQFTF